MMVLVITKAGVVPDDRVWVRLLSACHVFSQSTGPGAVSAEALLGVLLECMRAQSLEPSFNSAVLRALWARREGAGAAGEHDAAQNDAGGASSAISTAGGSGVDAGSPARNAVPPSPRPADVVTQVLADLQISAHMRARQVSACVRARARVPIRVCERDRVPPRLSPAPLPRYRNKNTCGRNACGGTSPSSSSVFWVNPGHCLSLDPPPAGWPTRIQTSTCRSWIRRARRPCLVRSRNVRCDGWLGCVPRAECGLRGFCTRERLSSSSSTQSPACTLMWPALMPATRTARWWRVRCWLRSSRSTRASAASLSSSNGLLVSGVCVCAHAGSSARDGLAPRTRLVHTRACAQRWHIAREHAQTYERTPKPRVLAHRWAKTRGINDASVGTLNSYAYSLLVPFTYLHVCVSLRV